MGDLESNYKGEVLNCIRHGKGTYKYEIGGNGLFVYDGLWSNGSKNGSKGKFTMKGIHQITSDFSNGEITGHGVKTWSDGRRYEGAWLNGEMHGKGDWISSNGDERYTGSFRDNKREGFGALVLSRAASIYRGNFSLHKKNGSGTFLCSNSFFLEANFIDNIIQGMVKIKWHKVASLVGLCIDGLFDNICCYSAADGSYVFEGLFCKGLPLPQLESSYVYLQLDRCNVIVKTLEEPVLTITPGKKTPGSAKKTKIVEVEVQQLQIQTGCEVGKIIIRAGTIKDIDDYKRKCEELAEVALSQVTTSKAGKNAKSTNAILDTEVVDPNCPPPTGRYNVPSEVLRNVILRIRSIISAEIEEPVVATKGKKEKEVVEKVHIPDTYGPYIPLWQRKKSQDKFGSSYNRFPLTCTAYIQGVRVTPGILGPTGGDDLNKSCDDGDVSVAPSVAHSVAQSVAHSDVKSDTKNAGHGSSHSALKSAEQSLVKGSEHSTTGGQSTVPTIVPSIINIGSLATFTASSSVQLITITASTSAVSGDGDMTHMTLNAHELTTTPTPPSGELLDGNDIINTINQPNANPSVTLRVPYNEISIPEKSITFFIDYTLNNDCLLDIFMANNCGEGQEEDRSGSIDHDNENNGNNRHLDQVMIPILNINKEYLEATGIGGVGGVGGIGASIGPFGGVGGNGPQTKAQTKTEEIVQLALIVPAAHFKLAANQRSSVRAAKLKKEAGRLLAAAEAARVREAEALANAAAAAAAASPKGKKEEKEKAGSKKKSISKGAKPEKEKATTKLSFMLPEVALPEKKEVVVEVEEEVSVVFPDINWTECTWELRVITRTTVLPASLAPAPAGSGCHGDSIGADGHINPLDALYAIESPLASPIKIPVTGPEITLSGSGSNVEGLEAIQRVVSVQQWNCGTFDPSIWHSLALSAYSVPKGGEITEDDDPNDPAEEEKGQDKEGGFYNPLFNPYFEVVLDGHGQVPLKTINNAYSANNTSSTKNANNTNNMSSNKSSSSEGVSNMMTSSALAGWMTSSDILLGGNHAMSPEDMLIRGFAAVDLENSLTSSLEFVGENCEIGEIGDVGESVLSPVLAFAVKVGGERAFTSGTGARAYGLPFQGSVKTLAVSGSGDRGDIPDITSCYSKWRTQEIDWADMKRKEEEMMDKQEKLTQQMKQDASNAAVNDSAGTAGAAGVPGGPGSPGVALFLTPPSAIPQIVLIPHDCRTVSEVTVSLTGGYGELDSLLLPSDTPPGRYVIEVTDGISTTCLRYPAMKPDSTPVPETTVTTVTSGNSLISTNPTQDPSTRNKATLEDMRHAATIVNPIRINQQITFHVVPVPTPVV